MNDRPDCPAPIGRAGHRTVVRTVLQDSRRTVAGRRTVASIRDHLAPPPGGPAGPLEGQDHYLKGSGQRETQPLPTAPASDEGMTTMTEQSSIRHSESHHIDTFRDGGSSPNPTETRMTPSPTPIPVHPLNVPNQGGPNTPTPSVSGRPYPAPMTTAQAVLAAIDERKPNLPDTYKHNLLFFCQGHHLATHGAPMFDEPLHATPTGATVTAGDPSNDDKISKRSLGMIGWVMHRYGDMFPVDLRSLVTASTAWQQGCSSPNNLIEQAWLTDWFSRPDELSHEGRIAVADIGAILGAART